MIEAGVVWYPPGEQADEALELSCEQKTSIATQLKDTPVLWNHTGTVDHVTSGRGFAELGKSNPKAGPLGTVTEAWVDEDGTGRAIVAVAPKMAAFLGTAVAPAVSLSHGVADDGRSIPVELSIVAKPARPGANVEAILNTPTARSDYIERCRQSAKLRTTMATNPDTTTAMNTEQEAPAAAPAISLVEQGVSGIRSAKQREAVERRMEEMAQCAMEANKNLEDLKAELARYKQQAATDGETTKEAVQMWVDSLGPDIAKRWHVDSFGDFNEPAWPQNFVRSMVMASHEKFNEMSRTAESTRPAKRQREEEAVPEMQSGAKPVAQQSNPLRAALANTFHVGHTAL